MYKTVAIGSWTGIAESPVEVLKVRRDGTIGSNDRSDFLYKRAGSHLFLNELQKLALHPDQLPIHLIALGAHEAYGCNRNGDSFTEDECRRNHGRFVKHAHLYRNHQNKDPLKSYGQVKLSAYNEDMRRIELLVFANEKQSAADRNGSLVLPDSVCRRLREGQMVPFSMACKVAYDVCGNCGNKAANRSEYCTQDNCVNPDTGRHMMGCRFGLTKLADDGLQQFVYNPDSHWMDISEVGRQADRTAFGGLADYMLQKAATANQAIGGAEMAELMGLYDLGGISALDAPLGSNPTQHMLLDKLAQLEQGIGFDRTAHQAAVLGAPQMKAQSVPLRYMSPANFKFAAEEMLVLPPDLFAMAVAETMTYEKAAAMVAAAGPALANAFTLLSRDPNVHQLLQQSEWVKMADPALLRKTAEEGFQKWVWQNRNNCSLGATWAVNRIHANIGDTQKSARAENWTAPDLEKAASCGATYIKFAKHYALYQLGVVSSFDKVLDQPVILHQVLGLNRV